jgi:putative endonuclease
MVALSPLAPHHHVSRVSGKPYFVYVLWSPSGRVFYVGISDDVGVRVAQHNAGKHASWTRKHRPWVVVHTENYCDYRSARCRELDLKLKREAAAFS